MEIYINGSLREVENDLSITALLASLGMAGKPVIVELNELAIFPREYGGTFITQGSRVELVALAAGG